MPTAISLISELNNQWMLIVRNLFKRIPVMNYGRSVIHESVAREKQINPLYYLLLDVLLFLASNVANLALPLSLSFPRFEQILVI